jgi:hypothetical protein
VEEPARAANRYGVLIALIVVSYAVSVADDEGSLAFPVAVVQLVTVVFALLASGAHRVGRIAALLATLAVLVAVASVLGLTTEQPGALYAVNIVLYLVAPVVVIRHVLTRPTVDLQALLGAVAAYLLLGMLFAFVYRAVAAAQVGAPFFGDRGTGEMSEFLFFSFVTLTTTGYGNLVPAGNPGQSLAVLETLLGQLFLIVALGKVVAAWPGRRGSG